MLQCLGRSKYPYLLVTYFDSSNDCPSVILAQRRIVGAEFFTHQLGKTFDEFRCDSALGIGELPFKHDGVGFHMHELFGQLVVLFSETRVRCCQMALGNKIKQAIDTSFEVRLPSLQLPQLLPSGLDRLGSKIEPARKEIAKPLGYPRCSRYGASDAARSRTVRRREDSYAASPWRTRARSYRRSGAGVAG